MELVRIDAPDPRLENSYARSLEQGDILFFPVTPFELSASDQAFLRSLSVGGAGHKNIAYKTSMDKVTGDSGADGCRLLEVFRAYSQHVIQLVGRILPRYAKRWKIDYASFRPEEEEGRDLPWKKRNDLLHVDAFPSRPTNGGLILRVFTNVHTSKARVWITGDPFEIVARQYAADAGLGRIASRSRSGLQRVKSSFRRSLGRPFRLPDRSPYDCFMLDFHDYLKRSAAYQKDCTKYRFEFPPGSTWMVFTDIVPHAVLSGQYALEQTFIIPRDSLVSPEKAPASILERLSATRLTD